MYKDAKNSGNELNNLLKRKELTLIRAQKRTENELVFVRKKGQIYANKDQTWREKRGRHPERRVPILNLDYVLKTVV